MKGLSNEQCSGVCAQGYYCPAGSTSPFQKICGGSDRYCPSGSGAPILVWEGHYTVNDFNGTCGAGRFRNFTNVVDETISPVMKTSVTPTKVPVAPCDLCPEGKYKHVGEKGESWRGVKRSDELNKNNSLTRSLLRSPQLVTTKLSAFLARTSPPA